MLFLELIHLNRFSSEDSNKHLQFMFLTIHHQKNLQLKNIHPKPDSLGTINIL